MSTETTLIPDLLRRFVATPVLTEFCIANSRVRLETNDSALANVIQRATAGPKWESSSIHSNWKLIRDEQAPRGGSEVRVLAAGPVSVLLLGHGTVVFVDEERCEVFGFLAPDVTAEKFIASLLPQILQLLRHPPDTLSQ